MTKTNETRRNDTTRPSCEFQCIIFRDTYSSCAQGQKFGAGGRLGPIARCSRHSPAQNPPYPKPSPDRAQRDPAQPGPSPARPSPAKYSQSKLRRDLCLIGACFVAETYLKHIESTLRKIVSQNQPKTGNTTSITNTTRLAPGKLRPI